MRYLMTFSYDGSKYMGYQKQPGEKTIQEVIENALTCMHSGKRVSLVASGRTDRGVHALNQKAHFDFEKEIPLEKLRYSLNSLLDGSIYIKEITCVRESFHARFDVHTKEYIYKINMGEYDPIEKDYVFQYNKKLDIIAMERALKYLEGTHDFQTFTKKNSDYKSYTRTIFRASLQRELKSGNKIILSFLGNGFLRYMVRNMVGFLLEIGEGKRECVEVLKVLNLKDRSSIGKTAPPEGLYLKDVFYH